ACGTPFVASAVGGVPEIAGHDAARLVPSEQPELLAAELERTLADRPQVAEAHRPHTLRQFASRVAALAESLIAARRGGAPACNSHDTTEGMSQPMSGDEPVPVRASQSARSPHFASSPESVVHP
ncbi:MAG TPA: hypothetical protein PLV92_23975, partial [Pirellulaceae bacterium]|nr:hypothetical protein [Pirellulaceae bacterium]